MPNVSFRALDLKFQQREWKRAKLKKATTATVHSQTNFPMTFSFKPISFVLPPKKLSFPSSSKVLANSLHSFLFHQEVIYFRNFITKGEHFGSTKITLPLPLDCHLVPQPSTHHASSKPLSFGIVPLLPKDFHQSLLLLHCKPLLIP